MECYDWGPLLAHSERFNSAPSLVARCISTPNTIKQMHTEATLRFASKVPPGRVEQTCTLTARPCLRPRHLGSSAVVARPTSCWRAPCVLVACRLPMPWTFSSARRTSRSPSGLVACCPVSALSPSRARNQWRCTCWRQDIRCCWDPQSDTFLNPE